LTDFAGYWVIVVSRPVEQPYGLGIMARKMVRVLEAATIATVDKDLNSSQGLGIGTNQGEEF